ncbi:hypothetical protein [Desulfatitalea alkaliphila]|uniref:Uncharacterized protein n=1 Tax=Desulfatitalea alkaliphila TaxID=2929485 RepID=A0AA41UK27_9BACT|nr:hypothetical protein [Desulfatitalea alkaliphila]MCJ8501854.1 hypothetical protein [Desulfatitalea alkaliphila]
MEDAAISHPEAHFRAMLRGEKSVVVWKRRNGLPNGSCGIYNFFVIGSLSDRRDPAFPIRKGIRHHRIASIPS